MRGLLPLSLLVILSLACNTVTARLAGTPTPGPTAAYQMIVNDFVSLHTGRLPAWLETEDARRQFTDEEIDVMAYFDVLDQLALEPGYVLDYVYNYDFMGGYPVLYARPEAQAPYATLAEFAGAGSPGADYLAHVVAQDTPEAYFQFVVLDRLAGQFYLYWHANYFDTQIVANRAALEQVIAAHTGDSGGTPFTAAQVKTARALAVEPVVELAGDQARVRIITFTDWGGFSEVNYTVSRSFPHKLERESENVMEYDVGIVF